jgi:hypothetical protein
MINFLSETQKTLEFIKKTPSDISFIGSANGHYGCDWDSFVKLADFSYDNGFGIEEVPVDLIVVFNDDSRLVRENYDGSECWHYISKFIVPTEYKPIRCLKLDGHGPNVEDIFINFREDVPKLSVLEPSYEVPQPIWE